MGRFIGGPLAVAAASVLCLAAAPAALAQTRTTTRTTISAKLTWKRAKYQETRDLTLTISRSGHTVYKARVVTPRSDCGSICTPIGHPRILALDGGSEPQVIIRLWSGGANCCEIDQVFSYSAARNTYTPATHNFAYAGSSIRDLDHNGRYEFVTADAAFKYTFTDGAASGQPIQVLEFRTGRFVNVTRRYPKLIAADAAGWLKAFKSMAPKYQDSVGVIAAWAADEDELGHSKQVAAFLARQARAGHLNSALDPKESGERFIRHLNRFLRRQGYLR